MDSQTAVTMKTVTDTFLAWKTVHDERTKLQKSFELALGEHAGGKAPFPTELQAKIAVLSAESDRLLLAAQHALLKIKTPRSSSPGGDSTWS